MKRLVILLLLTSALISCTTQRKPIYTLEKFVVEKCDKGYPVLKKLKVEKYPQVGDTIYRLKRVEPRF